MILTTLNSIALALACSGLCTAVQEPVLDQNWPGFRGAGASGVVEGHELATNWNADVEQGVAAGVLWRTPVPGLGHSSPVVWGERVFVCSAIAKSGEAALMLGAGGKPTAADDSQEHSWVVLCFDKTSGEELWRRTAHRGIPRTTRHVKATQANTSVAVDGENVVAFFGSEGLYCYDLDGKLKWSRDLGVIDISKYGIGWGYASSPALHKDRIAIVCDDPSAPYVAVLNLADGKELWRASRAELSERSWGTPLILEHGDVTHVVINGWPWVISYELESGKELWRIQGGGDNPIPTPFVANGWIYISSAHGRMSPIYVVRPEARGDITPSKSEPSNDGMVWSVSKGGSYMSTPVVYGGYIYLASSSFVRCYDAKTGEKLFAERLGDSASIIASLVAADGKIYCTSEEGAVYVLAAGPEFEVIARNPMGEPCFATPAISEGVLFFRTTKSLLAIGK
ncbi:MAG: outer membrane protein assembly factor BamB [Planctomycetota bacterium]|jgi:outer membrane protein assembly factor BamB